MFDARILPSGVLDPSKKVPNVNCGVQDLLLDVVDLKLKTRGVGSESRRDPPPPI